MNLIRKQEPDPVEFFLCQNRRCSPAEIERVQFPDVRFPNLITDLLQPAGVVLADPAVKRAVAADPMTEWYMYIGTPDGAPSNFRFLFHSCHLPFFSVPLKKPPLMPAALIQTSCPDPMGHRHQPSSSMDRTAMNASCGISTDPTIFMRFLPSFCFSSSFFFREISPP